MKADNQVFKKPGFYGITPPPWRDKEAVINFVDELLDEAERLATIEDASRMEHHPGIPYSELIARVERDAVNMATKHGDYQPLISLIDPRNPMPPARLSPSTFALIRDIMNGEHKRPANRPPLAEEVKRVFDPIYDAVDEVRRIQAILEDAYPKKRGHLKLAIKIVAKRGVNGVLRGIDEDRLRRVIERGPEKREGK
jgi:hypothetical protein